MNIRVQAAQQQNQLQQPNPTPPVNQTGLLSTATQLPNMQQAMPTYTDPRANILYGGGNAKITDQDIRNFINQPGRTEQEIFQEALRRGISADQVTQAMQGTPFTQQAVNQYITNQGVSRELNQPQAPVAQVQQVRLPEFKPAPFTQAVRDPTEGTVAGNLERVLDPNSPLMQRAASMGMQQANRRGLLNSSIGITAAQAPMVDAGLQIATPDAASANQFALQNAETQNLMDRFNAEQGLKAGMFSADLLAQNQRFNAGQVNEMMGLQLGHQHQGRMAALENQYRAQIQNSMNSASLYQQTMGEIGRILSNMELTPEAKQSQVDNMMSLLSQGLAVNGALANTGIAQAFGAQPGGGTAQAVGQQPGVGSLTVGGQQPGQTQPGQPQPGTTSAITGGQIGPTGQGTFVIGTGEKITQQAADAIQELYGVDPTGLVDVFSVIGGVQGAIPINHPSRLANMSGPERAEVEALVARYPTAQQLRQALDSEQVALIPMFDPKFGEPYHPAFLSAGVKSGQLIYDPNNVLGLRA